MSSSSLGWKLFRSSVHRENFSSTRKIFQRGNFFSKKKFGSSRSIPSKNRQNRSYPRDFEPFKVQKFCMPFFGEFSRSSQDLRESDYDSIKSWDDRPNLPKNGVQKFWTSNGSKIARIAPISTIFGRNRSRRPKLFFPKFQRRRNSGVDAKIRDERTPRRTNERPEQIFVMNLC